MSLFFEAARPPSMLHCGILPGKVERFMSALGPGCVKTLYSI
jgi:hypothetical protein